MNTEEILRGTLESLESYDDLMLLLAMTAAESRTTNLSVDNLIKLVFIMMLFARPEREVDWSLHLWAVAAMMPYFSQLDISTMLGMDCTI